MTSVYIARQANSPESQSDDGSNCLAAHVAPHAEEVIVAAVVWRSAS